MCYLERVSVRSRYVARTYQSNEGVNARKSEKVELVSDDEMIFGGEMKLICQGDIGHMFV